jgi:hypothetical protein
MMSSGRSMRLGMNMGVGSGGGASRAQGTTFYGLTFDGGDEVVISDNISLDPESGDFSVSFWMKTSLTGAAVFTKYTLDDSDGWRFFVEANGYLSWQVLSTGTNSVNNQTDVQTNDGLWHFVTGTIDQTGTGKNHFYIDDQEVGTAANVASASVVSTSDVYMGRFDGVDTRHYTGEVEQLRIGKGVVRSLAGHLEDRTNTTLVGWETEYWPLLPGTGTTAVNSIDAGNNGTFGGGAAAPTWVGPYQRLTAGGPV